MTGLLRQEALYFGLDVVGRQSSTLGADGCAFLGHLHCIFDEAGAGASVDRPFLYVRVLAYQVGRQVGHVQLLGLATGTVPRGAPMNFVVPTLQNLDTYIRKVNTIAIFCSHRRGLAMSTGRRITDTIVSLITDSTVTRITDSTVTRITYISVTHIAVPVRKICGAPSASVCSKPLLPVIVLRLSIIIRLAPPSAAMDIATGGCRSSRRPATRATLGPTRTAGGGEPSRRHDVRRNRRPAPEGRRGGPCTRREAHSRWGGVPRANGSRTGRRKGVARPRGVARRSVVTRRMINRARGRTARSRGDTAASVDE